MEILDLNNATDHMDLTDIHRTFYLTTAGYTHSQVHMEHLLTYHMLAHKKVSMSNFKKSENVPRIISDHNGIQLKMSSRSKTDEYRKTKQHSPE